MLGSQPGKENTEQPQTHSVIRPRTAGLVSVHSSPVLKRVCLWPLVLSLPPTPEPTSMPLFPLGGHSSVDLCFLFEDSSVPIELLLGAL